MASDAERLLHRFRRQIAYAAKFIAGKHGYIDIDDARQQAALLTLEYLKSGKIDELQAKVDDNPGFAIEQLFQQEIKRDLQDWVKKEARDRKRAAQWADRYRELPASDPIKEVEYRLSFPVLCMMHYDRMTIKEIAARLGVGESSVDRMIAAEKAAGQRIR